MNRNPEPHNSVNLDVHQAPSFPEERPMNALLIYPEFPDTFWSFKHALKFLGKLAAQPPLGLMTVAALLPGAWKKRLVDTIVEPLRDRDLT
jgi:hypothetical protein